MTSFGKMSKTKNILLISTIIHVSLFIVLTYVAMPPFPYQANSGIINAEIFKVKPDMENKIQKSELANEKKSLNEEAKKPIENTFPVLEPADFSLSIREPNESIKRKILYQKETKIVSKQKITELVTAKPLITVAQINKVNDIPSIKQVYFKRNKNELPNLNQNVGNLYNAESSTKFRGIGVGTMVGNNSVRGISTKYIDAMTSVNPKMGVSQFAQILSSLAESIINRAISNMLDIVFIIDITGSMQDNAEGVKNYIHSFLDPIKDKKIDINLGLVLFSDQEVKKAKVIGTTDNVEKFKKWFEKIKFYGGRDLPESGYEAILTAIDNVKFRDRSQKFFIFISDSMQHDSDYDGKSIYSIDQIISILNQKNISVDVIGLDYLPIKQLAWGTGGQWNNIPSGDVMLDLPQYKQTRIHSNLSTPSRPDVLEDNVKIKFDSAIPIWVELSYKVLDPKGKNVLEMSAYRKEVKSTNIIDFLVKIDFGNLQSDSGIYTLIYKVKDSLGNQDFLRQALQVTVDE